MVQLTRIYTKGGDKGKTSLGNGTRTPKSAPRVIAMGDVDELNSLLGVTLTYCENKSDLYKLIRHIQNELFDLGADLCMPDDTPHKLTVSAAQVTYLEQQIDAFNHELPPLTSFVLPGGNLLGATLHQCRTVARRAERSVCALHEEQAINQHAIVYLNRLSDLLFVLARYVNIQTQEEVLWVPGKSR